MRLLACALLCLVPSTFAFAAEADKNPASSSDSTAINFAPDIAPEQMPGRAKDIDSPATVTLSRDEMCNTLTAAAQRHALPVAFFTSLIWQESGFRPEAVSPVGAQGVAQFMPRVASAMGLDNPFNPLEALPMAARLLRTLVDQFNGNFGLAAAAYNYGPTRVVRWMEKKGKLPKETRDYVMTITGRPAEEWRDANLAMAGFTAPARTRCPIVHSRAEVAQSGRLRFQEVANVPLPPQRPDPNTLVANNTFENMPEYEPRPQPGPGVSFAPRPSVARTDVRIIRAGAPTRQLAAVAMQPSMVARQTGFIRNKPSRLAALPKLKLLDITAPKTQVLAVISVKPKRDAKATGKLANAGRAAKSNPVKVIKPLRLASAKP